LGACLGSRKDPFWVPQCYSHSPAPSHEMTSFDSVNRYLDSLQGETTYGPAQDDGYMTEDSGDDTSVYSESSSASDETQNFKRSGSASIKIGPKSSLLALGV
jgi:hypothetical protein